MGTGIVPLDLLIDHRFWWRLLVRPTQTIHDVMREGGWPLFITMGLICGVLATFSQEVLGGITQSVFLSGVTGYVPLPLAVFLKIVESVILAGPLRLLTEAFFLNLVGGFMGSRLYDFDATAVVVAIGNLPRLPRILATGLLFKWGFNTANGLVVLLCIIAILALFLWGVILLIKGIRFVHDFTTGKAMACIVLAGAVEIAVSLILGMGTSLLF